MTFARAVEIGGQAVIQASKPEPRIMRDELATMNGPAALLNGAWPECRYKFQSLLLHS